MKDLHDSELLDALKNECARLAKIRELPDEKQKPYERGIAKLERRIEELRAACGMTLDDFTRQYGDDMTHAHLTREEAQKVDYATLGDYTSMASEAWKRGDIDALNEARAGIRRTVQKAKTAKEGTA